MMQCCRTRDDDTHGARRACCSRATRRSRSHSDAGPTARTIRGLIFSWRASIAVARASFLLVADRARVVPCNADIGMRQMVCASCNVIAAQGSQRHPCIEIISRGRHPFSLYLMTDTTNRDPCCFNYSMYIHAPLRPLTADQIAVPRPKMRNDTLLYMSKVDAQFLVEENLSISGDKV